MDRRGRRGPLRPAAGAEDRATEKIEENALHSILACMLAFRLSVSQLPACTEGTLHFALGSCMHVCRSCP